MSNDEEKEFNLEDYAIKGIEGGYYISGWLPPLLSREYAKLSLSVCFLFLFILKKINE